MWELFSRREAKKANAGVEDVYQYSTLPNTLRVQFIHIMNEAMGRVSMYDQTIPPNVSWNAIANTMRDEKGLFKLTQKPTNNTQEECYHYIMDATALDVIDLIEYAFIVVVTYGKSLADYQRQNYELCDPDDAIKKLNRRFKEHSVGYEFSGRRIIRVDSTFIHSEAVKPALQLMSASKLFAGPLQEFTDAHEHFRNGDNKEAIVSANKSFESVCKSICTSKGWSFDPAKAGASKLIDLIFKNSLIPSHLQSHVTSLRSVLESGVPTVRNRDAAHGQGSTPTELPDYYAAFVLHLTASNIVFLIRSYESSL